MEHERYQDLQHKYQRMQEDYEKQLKDAAESKIQAVEELTQLFEARLQDKTQLLAQVSQHGAAGRGGRTLVTGLVSN